MENKKRRWFPRWPTRKGEDQEIQELHRKIDERPDDPRPHQRLAELLLERGRKAEAIGEFIKAAECHSRAGFYLRAIALYRRILRMDEESQEILLRLAELYLANGLLGDALVQFRKVVKQYRQKGKGQEVIGVLRRMIEVDPENLEVRLKYVELLRSEGFSPHAFDELLRIREELKERGRAEATMEIDRQILSLRQELTEEFTREGRSEDLIVLEQKLQALLSEESPQVVPQDGAAPGEIDLEVAEGLAEEEAGQALEGLAEEEDSILSRFGEARLYAEQGLFEEAEEIFQAILDAHPQHDEARRALEEVREERKRIRAPADPSSVFQKLNALEARSQPKQGREEEKGAVGTTMAKQPADAKMHFELALAYRDLGLIEESMEELRVASADPSLAFACYMEMAACLRGKGELAEAITYLRKALRCPGVSQEGLLDASYQMAQILEQRGMRDQALVLYKKIGEKNQTFRDVQERVRNLTA
ncbi:MAG: tetratricopeptide repeat protein [Thermodesulfobacteriota bacterium]